MLTIYRVEHIGQVMPELAPQAKLLEGLFGFRRLQSWENAEEGVRGMLYDVPGTWGDRWELLAPLGEGSPLQAHLDANGPGIHHVAVEVPDMDVAVRQLEALGVDAKRRSANKAGTWIDFPFVPLERDSGLLLRVVGPSAEGACGAAGTKRGPAAGGGAPDLGIVAIEQVGQAYWDRDELVRWCEAALGMHDVYRTPEGKHPDIATLVLTIPGTRMRWEIIQPAADDSFVQRFLDKRGARAHHVTFEIRDWDNAMAACEHHEVPVFGTNEGETDGARWADTFIHPRHAGGVLVQLFWEERPGVWSRSDKVPSSNRT